MGFLDIFRPDKAIQNIVHSLPNPFEDSSRDAFSPASALSKLDPANIFKPEDIGLPTPSQIFRDGPPDPLHIFDGAPNPAKLFGDGPPDPLHIFDGAPNPAKLFGDGPPDPLHIFDGAPNPAKLFDGAPDPLNLFGDGGLPRPDQVLDRLPNPLQPFDSLFPSPKDVANGVGQVLDFGDPRHLFADEEFRGKNIPRLDSLRGRTSTELMDTLQAHWGEINGPGKDQNHISKTELATFLKTHPNLDAQDRDDLTTIMNNFGSICSADGRDGKRGISMRDTNAFVAENYYHDEKVMMARNYMAMRQENGTTPIENQPAPGSDNPTPTIPPIETTVPTGDHVITQRAANGHFEASGANIPLSQEEFKKHYGIDPNIDLTKFMPGKANDGTVPDFWGSGASVGLGGRLDDNSLKWDHADRHDLKYDFSRNLAQVFRIGTSLPPDQQEEFMFNFARTQAGVFKANGYDLQQVSNEKVYSVGQDGNGGWTDFVQNVGSGDKSLMQW